MRISDWSSDVCSSDLIYAPIAQRLGIYFIRTELEDLAFANLYPNRYSVMVKSVKAQLGDTRKLIREVEQTLATALREEGIGASVVGRAKNIYGVYQKMRRDRKSTRLNSSH